MTTAPLDPTAPINPATGQPETEQERVERERREAEQNR